MKWIALIGLLLGVLVIFLGDRWGSEDYNSGAFIGTATVMILGVVLILASLVTFVVLIFNTI